MLACIFTLVSAEQIARKDLLREMDESVPVAQITDARNAG